VRGPGADEHYWQALETGRFELQRCAGCGQWNWPAVWRCGTCGSWEQGWHPVSLQGHVFSWTRTWHDFGSAPQFVRPFVTVLVELDQTGGRRVLGTVCGDSAGIHIGARVSGRIIRVALEDRELPALQWQLLAARSASGLP
jgi:uncharacterized protein